MRGWDWWISQFLLYLPQWNTVSLIAFAACVLAIVVVIMTLRKKLQLEPRKTVCLIICSTYVLLVLFSTVITRPSYEGVHIRLIPFLHSLKLGNLE